MWWRSWISTKVEHHASLANKATSRADGDRPGSDRPLPGGRGRLLPSYHGTGASLPVASSSSRPIDEKGHQSLVYVIIELLLVMGGGEGRGTRSREAGALGQPKRLPNQSADRLGSRGLRFGLFLNPCVERLHSVWEQPHADLLPFPCRNRAASFFCATTN